jgi:hypothetical protein
MYLADTFKRYLGWCPNAPSLRTAPAVLMVPPETIHPAQPDGSGSAGRPGRIRDGISIAAGSLKAMVRDRQLLWFTFLSGLIMLFLVLTEAWNNTQISLTPTFPLAITAGDSSIYLNLQDLWVDIPAGNSSLFIDLHLFLLELACMSGFILILAGLVLHRIGNRGKAPVTVREGLSMVRASLVSLAILSMGMALLATVLYSIISHSELVGGFIHTITMALFWLPYDYYRPSGIFAVLYASANFFAVEIMAINIILFLAALYLVPVIVLEKKGLISAIIGSGTLLWRTWREVLGCILVFGLIALGIFAVGLLIGQSPVLVNNDLDFFISRSRGYMPMMAVCYGFILTCWALMAVGFTAAGVALSDLYTFGTTGRVPDPLKEN